MDRAQLAGSATAAMGWTVATGMASDVAGSCVKGDDVADAVCPLLSLSPTWDPTAANMPIAPTMDRAPTRP